MFSIGIKSWFIQCYNRTPVFYKKQTSEPSNQQHHILNTKVFPNLAQMLMTFKHRNYIRLSLMKISLMENDACDSRR